METRNEFIIFMHDKDRVLELPFCGYRPGDIKRTKERLARELSCGIEDIEVRIIGLMEKETIRRFRVIEGGAKK